MQGATDKAPRLCNFANILLLAGCRGSLGSDSTISNTLEEVRDVLASEDTNTTSRGVSACSTDGLAAGAACRATPLLAFCAAQLEPVR